MHPGRNYNSPGLEARGFMSCINIKFNGRLRVFHMHKKTSIVTLVAGTDFEVDQRVRLIKAIASALGSAERVQSQH